MIGIIRKLIYFTLLQILVWTIVAAALNSPFTDPLPVRTYILLTLFFDIIFSCGLYVEHKTGPAFLTIRELNLLRIYLLVLFIAAIAGHYYKDPVGITLLFIFIFNVTAPVFSTNNFWFCHECGKRYGIRIWTSNHCPRCGANLSKKRYRN